MNDLTKKKEKKQNILIVLGLIVLIGMIGGLTFAFYNYTRTGQTNTLRLGRIAFETGETSLINLSNAFPIDVSNGIPSDDNIVGTYTITITGDTDYADGVEYLITTVNSHVSTNTGKTIPISIDVNISNGLGSMSNTYFTARESKNTTIYKRLSGDVVVGDQQLLVGYIKPNTTRGEAEGVDGTITIKAYLDKERIAITDTYDDTGIVSALNGTTDEWVDDRVYLTTAEWNSLKNNGIDFQVKVEANEGIWVDEPIYNKLRMNAYMDNTTSPNVSSSTGIDFSKISGNGNGEGLYVRATTENDAYPVVYYRGNVSDNNVYFGGKCWQMVRTTDTGGVKMIYNGENTGSEAEPKCEPTSGEDRQITLNIDGVDTNRFRFAYGNAYPNFSGYMYNSTNFYAFVNYETDSKFGNGVTWDGENYTITDVSDTLDANHHYTCGKANATKCSSIRYYFYVNNSIYQSYMLTNGKMLEDLINESLENGNNESNAKVMIDTWYEENLYNTIYEEKIEDTIYCNDRSIYSLGGMNPNGGTLTVTDSTNMNYSGYKRLYVTYTPSTKCRRVADSFTKNSTKGNGLLDYSVGLITSDEIAMAGGKYRTVNNNFYLYTGFGFLSMSPSFFLPSTYFFRVNSQGALNNVDSADSTVAGLRPVISLKLGTSIASGDGSVGSPYILK